MQAVVGITIIDFYDDKEPSLMIIIAGPRGTQQGCQTKRLMGVIFEEGAQVLIDMGATHNFIDITFIRQAGIPERRTKTSA